MCEISPEEIFRDNDIFAGDEFYVIFDKPYPYFLSDNLGMKNLLTVKQYAYLVACLKEECRKHGQLNKYEFIVDESRNCEKLSLFNGIMVTFRSLSYM